MSNHPTLLRVQHHANNHSWIEVPIGDLRRFGLADQISYFSYVGNGVVFLEEELDAFLYKRAVEEAGLALSFTPKYYPAEAFIRSLPRYRQQFQNANNT